MPAVEGKREQDQDQGAGLDSLVSNRAVSASISHPHDGAYESGHTGSNGSDGLPPPPLGAVKQKQPIQPCSSRTAAPGARIGDIRRGPKTTTSRPTSRADLAGVGEQQQAADGRN
jgi:hypothetical protein